jgi:hypothetical protein
LSSCTIGGFSRRAQLHEVTLVRQLTITYKEFAEVNITDALSGQKDLNNSTSLPPLHITPYRFKFHITLTYYIILVSMSTLLHVYI